jgi:hypothetical protein
MTDYRTMPLGPVAPNRIGEIAKCPHCGEHGLKVEDFKDPASGSKEKETIYIHFEDTLPRPKTEDGRTGEEFEIVTLACPIRLKPKSPEETPLE